MSMRATMTRALATALVLIGVAVPAGATVSGDIGEQPANGTDGWVCYAPVIPFRSGAVAQDDPCGPEIQLVALPVKIPPVLVPAPTEITVHYRTIPVERAVGYVPVQDAVMIIPKGSPTGNALVQLRPSQLPEERFVLEIFRPSLGRIVNPRVTVTIKQRG